MLLQTPLHFRPWQDTKTIVHFANVSTATKARTQLRKVKLYTWVPPPPASIHHFPFLALLRCAKKSLLLLSGQTSYNIFWTCVCILSYIAGKVHALYYSHLWPVWLYHIFSHYLIKSTIFGKKLLNINCVFWFSLQRLSETILIVRRIQRDSTINLGTSSYQYQFFCHILIKHEFSRQIFEKYSDMKFHENPSSGNRVISMRTDRQTDNHGRANSRFSKFCERAYNQSNDSIYLCARGV